MFQKLKEKWKVNSLNLFLIIATFALGGSACAAIGRIILNTADIEKRSLSGGALYVLLITLLWPICVLVISFPLGQSTFFKNYLNRVFKKIKGKRG